MAASRRCHFEASRHSGEGRNDEQKTSGTAITPSFFWLTCGLQPEKRENPSKLALHASLI
jgi:hypothetical protein